MNGFGMLLRNYRQRCKDPDRPERPLSQERFGELLGREVGIGFSGAAISDWERGVSKIHADQRPVLISIIKVLQQCGGVDNPKIANTLLQAGNYRDLDEDEVPKIFPAWQKEHQLHHHLQSKELATSEENNTDVESWPPGIPFEPYYPLPGREIIAANLLSLLAKSDGPRIIAIEGLGGQGKTALAAELARRAQRNGLVRQIIGETAKQEIFAEDEIIHLQSSTLDYESLLDGLARQLRRWELFAMSAKEKELLISQVFSQSHYLIIVDNLEVAVNSQAIVVRLGSILGSSQAIITSREKIRTNSLYSQVLDGLSLEDSEYFLRAESQRIGTDLFLNAEREELSEIYRLTGGSPLAMKLVVAQTRYLDLDWALERLRKAGGNLFPFVFHSIWEQLKPEARNVLLYVGKTVVENVGLHELAEARLADNAEALVNAIDQLIAYSVLNYSRSLGEVRYSVHQLTRQFLISDLPDLWRGQGLL